MMRLALLIFVLSFSAQVYTFSLYSKKSKSKSFFHSKLNAALLYDMPVSNNGARVRIILRSKKLDEKSLVTVVPPSNIGGLKSEQYLELNPEGKMPLLVLENGLAIPESDTISSIKALTLNLNLKI